MSISRAGALPNSYKYIKLAIDSFEHRHLQGRIYHDSFEEGVAFHCISEMAICLEQLFDTMRYPMKSVEHRSFNPKESVSFPISEIKGAEAVCGKLAEYTLQVKYRFHSTWQGKIKNMRTGEIFDFRSFLELMGYFERSLGGKVEESTYGLGKRMCEVTVREYDRCLMGGDVSHPAVRDRIVFKGAFDLKEEIGHFLLPLPEGTEREKLIIPRSVLVQSSAFGNMTFVIRVLFRRNATWQGTISWKEKRKQVSFRSFLELLFLMEEAAVSGNWEEGSRREAAGNGVGPF